MKYQYNNYYINYWIQKYKNLIQNGNNIYYQILKLVKIIKIYAIFGRSLIAGICRADPFLDTKMTTNINIEIKIVNNFYKYQKIIS